MDENRMILAETATRQGADGRNGR